MQSGDALKPVPAPPPPRPPPSRALALTPISPRQFLIFRITDDKTFLELEHKGEKGASFEDFTSKLPDNDCRHAVLEISTKSGATANKLIFVAWSDDNARIGSKMLYASSKDDFKRALGINDEFQATERGDLRARLKEVVEGNLDLPEIVEKSRLG